MRACSRKDKEKGIHSVACCSPQEELRKGGPTNADCIPCLLASSVGLQGKSVSLRLLFRGEPGPLIWVGVKWDELLTTTDSEKLSPSHWGCLPRGSRQAHRASERSHPFFPSWIQAMEACYVWEKAQRKPWRNQLFLLKREKFQMAKKALCPWPTG